MLQSYLIRFLIYINYNRSLFSFYNFYRFYQGLDDVFNVPNINFAGKTIIKCWRLKPATSE